MASKYKISYPSGLFIPVEKQSLFMVAFEGMLLSNHNIIPVFGPATAKSTCEVKFDYLGNKSYKPESFVSDVEKALEFLNANMSILGTRRFSKRKKKSNCFKTTPQVITLDESEASTIDLTEGGQCEHELIILEDSIVHGERQTRQNRNCSSVVDLTEINEYKTPAKRKQTVNGECKSPAEREDSEVDVQVLNVKKFTPQKQHKTISSFGEIKIANNWKQPKKSKKRKRRVNPKSDGRTPTKTISYSSIQSDSLSSLSSDGSMPRKKQKLQDISNTRCGASCSISPSFAQCSNLSENTLKYYEKISKAVSNDGGEKKRSFTRKKTPVGNHKNKNFKRENKSLTEIMPPIQVYVENSKKRKVLIPQNSPRHRAIWNHKNKLTETSLNVRCSPRILTKKNLQKGISTKIGETNSFNPNPHEIDLEGLRPIVMDGCNVAISHGKGKFSPKGLMICVDYFVARGHTKIKVFLPQFRQAEIPGELLNSLKSKCDVVFTPSQCINGMRRTPYDDRFIVQYATEFGGVIVSTDNYRDLSRENPRWQDTIAKRLLMFTWVDDFLMFPVDPLGRSGPTLEEFLRF